MAEFDPIFKSKLILRETRQGDGIPESSRNVWSVPVQVIASYVTGHRITLPGVQQVYVRADGGITVDFNTPYLEWERIPAPDPNAALKLALEQAQQVLADQQRRLNELLAQLGKQGGGKG